MAPPTIAPVCLAPRTPLAVVSGAGGIVDVLVGDDESLADVGSEVSVGDGMLIVVRVPEAVVLEEEVEDDVVEAELSMPEPICVGVARLLGLCVKPTLSLVRCTSDETPVALSDTVAARSLAVPQPHWENPPSNMSL